MKEFAEREKVTLTCPPVIASCGYCTGSYSRKLLSTERDSENPICVSRDISTRSRNKDLGLTASETTKA